MYLPAISFWQQILQWDRQLFERLNGDWTNPVFDALMPWLRNSNTWIPLYLFLFVLVVLNFKAKGLWWALLFISTVALTDMTGTYLIKHEVQRLRPCNDPDLAGHVRLLLPRCAGGYGFISNHAANHFGMGMFFFISFRHLVGKWAWLGPAWGALVAYSQVYVGVHYPLDVLCGALLGAGIGTVMGSLFKKRFHFAIFEHQPTGLS